MINRFSILFPVQLEFKVEQKPSFQRPKWDKRVVSIHKHWKQLTQTAIIDKCDNYGIPTGAKNGITVIDMSAYSVLMDMLQDSGTMSVSTPSNGTQFYFQYEETLNSIYDTSVSVLNNKRCVFFGNHYQILNKTPIKKMPKEIFNVLHGRQQERETAPIFRQEYELLDLLPYQWFNNQELLSKLICAMRNTYPGNPRAISTIQSLLDDRSDTYFDKELDDMLNAPMTYLQKRFGMAALKKMIKRAHPVEYANWINYWKQLSSRLQFKAGAIVKYSDVKAYDSKITREKLLQLDPRFTAITKKICKSCRKRHLKNCCDKYSRTNNINCLFVNNCELK